MYVRHTCKKKERKKKKFTGQGLLLPPKWLNYFITFMKAMEYAGTKPAASAGGSRVIIKEQYIIYPLVRYLLHTYDDAMHAHGGGTVVYGIDPRKSYTPLTTTAVTNKIKSDAAISSIANSLAPTFRFPDLCQHIHRIHICLLYVYLKIGAKKRRVK